MPNVSKPSWVDLEPKTPTDHSVKLHPEAEITHAPRHDLSQLFATVHQGSEVSLSAWGVSGGSGVGAGQEGADLSEAAITDQISEFSQEMAEPATAYQVGGASPVELAVKALDAHSGSTLIENNIDALHTYFIDDPLSSAALGFENGAEDVAQANAGDTGVDMVTAAGAAGDFGQDASLSAGIDDSYISGVTGSEAGGEVPSEPPPPESQLFAPSVECADASGLESGGITLDIDVASQSVNVEGETIQVEISGVPDGSTFSAGTDLGDGTWQFDLDDLDGLTFNPPVGIEDYTLNVTATASAGDESLSSGSQFTVDVNAAGDTFTGTPGKDTIHGTEYSDVISGEGNKDTLYGGGGYDEMYGGAGDDTLRGEEGKDTLFGDAGKDKLYGGEGDDMLYGGEGKDTLRGGTGDDVLIGGEGNDKLFGDAGNDIFVFGLGDGNDQVRGGAGWTDTIQLKDITSAPDMGDWTLTTDHGYELADDGKSLLFDQEASGTIELPDGSTLDFNGIEKIEWE